MWGSSVSQVPCHIIISSQRKPLCIYLAFPVPPALHLELNCPDYPALVTQFSSLCHFLNKDIYLFSSFTTALDSTRKKREQAREFMPLSAAMSESAPRGEQGPAHLQTEMDVGSLR